MTCRPAEGAKAHRCASDTSKTFSQNACVSLPPSLVKTFRCDQGLCLIYHIEWIGSIPFSEGVKIQAFIPQITFGDTACAFIYVLSRYSLSPHIIWGNKHFEVSTDCCKLRVLARPYLKTIAENRLSWACPAALFVVIVWVGGGGVLVSWKVVSSSRIKKERLEVTGFQFAPFEDFGQCLKS